MEFPSRPTATILPTRDPTPQVGACLVRPDCHPASMGAVEIEAFLTHLAVAGRVSASTQNQAFNALLFLYQRVLQIELPRLV